MTSSPSVIRNAQFRLHSGDMRCGLSLWKQRLTPLRQLANRNPLVLRAVKPAMSESYSDRWEKQFWGKEGGLAQGEVRQKKTKTFEGLQSTAAAWRGALRSGSSP